MQSVLFLLPAFLDYWAVVDRFIQSISNHGRERATDCYVMMIALHSGGRVINEHNHLSPV